MIGTCVLFLIHHDISMKKATDVDPRMRDPRSDLQPWVIKAYISGDPFPGRDPYATRASSVGRAPCSNFYEANARRVPFALTEVD